MPTATDIKPLPAQRGKQFRNLIGKRLGRLVAIKPVALTNNGRYIWEFRCDCGNHFIIAPDQKKTKSCGCLTSELLSKINTKHGLSKSREHSIWTNMKTRCSNPIHINWNVYGGKGIRVCERWLHSFENFYADMGVCPSKMSIERINRNGNYEPPNCRWATSKEQANNKSTNHFLTYNGKTQTMSQWASELGMKKPTINSRVMSGWSDGKIITTPIRKQ